MSKLDGRETGSPASDTGGSNGRPTSSQVNNLLKVIYGSVENEGIPDRFLELLEKLDEAERKHAASVQN